jgi:hypothetical protein
MSHDVNVFMELKVSLNYVYKILKSVLYEGIFFFIAFLFSKSTITSQDHLVINVD